MRTHQHIRSLGFNETCADGTLFYLHLREALINNGNHIDSAAWLTEWCNVPVPAGGLSSNQLHTLARARLQGMAHAICSMLQDSNSTHKALKGAKLKQALAKLHI